MRGRTVLRLLHNLTKDGMTYTIESARPIAGYTVITSDGTAHAFLKLSVALAWIEKQLKAGA
jgi:hypothetical protein